MEYKAAPEGRNYDTSELLRFIAYTGASQVAQRLCSGRMPAMRQNLSRAVAREVGSWARSYAGCVFSIILTQIFEMFTHTKYWDFIKSKC